ncbi:MAG: metallophosphoesterase family protein [Synechococcales bacterium]|nr:metallophosphoesterase family protein [Synechococcales bacterium]
MKPTSSPSKRLFPPLRPRWWRARFLWIGVLCLAVVLLFGSFRAAYGAYRAYMGRPPDQVHLSWVTDPARSFTVLWHTHRPNTASLIEYRRQGETQWRQEIGMIRRATPNGSLHEVTIADLTPNTTYEYRLKGDFYGNVWSNVFQVKTAPAAGPADFDAVYVADTGLVGRRDGLATGTAQVVAEIAKLKPFLVLAGGDYAYYDKDRRYATLDKTIDVWFNQMMPVFSQSPVMPTYGNHEAILKENYTTWLERFATPAGFDHQRNYSFDIGNVHFVSIFAVYEEQGLNPAVLDWLEQDLQAAQAAGQTWLIPFMHVSAFAEGASHPSNLALRAQLGPLFERFGVKLVLSSHDQAYERTYPLVNVPEQNQPTTRELACYTLEEGTTWLKVSPGGKESNKSNHFSVFEADPSPWVAVRDNTQHVFAQLQFAASGSLAVNVFGVKGDGASPALVDAFMYTNGRCE